MGKKVCVPMISLCLLMSGCGQMSTGELALVIRDEYKTVESGTALLSLVADYGQRIYQYDIQLEYQGDETTLTLVQPAEIAGIRVNILKGETTLEYEGVQVETGALDEIGLSPVGSVPLFYQSLRESFIGETCLETVGESQWLRVDYREPDQVPGTGHEVTLWFDTSTYHVTKGELSYDGYRIIDCTVVDMSVTCTQE